MDHLVELSGESEELAIAEALAVARSVDAGAGIVDVDGRALVLRGEFASGEVARRLALAWSVSELLHSGSERDLFELLERLELPGTTFRIKVQRLGDQPPAQSSELVRKAGTILARRYKVDLDSPDVELRILLGTGLHAGLLAGEIDRSALESRKAEYRPFNHPISLHPKLARALVNLTGIKSGQTLLDPFCGTGGILLEAGLMGCKVLGGDIDQRMVDGTILNLAQFGIKEPDIRRLDVSDWDKEIDAIATDPPYGRSASTAKENISSLYQRAFGVSKSLLRDGGRLGIILPDEAHARLCGMELELIQPVRVHRSLTRYFCVFRKT